ncbi:hypothetical protein SMD44_00914 [Streptomyces alboflavus]|uniref:Uncharacterized protein n=1 Tax=Streptomyces alboflavus TaxID=67267 RepID=A0A1Z1W517_9ACTN|nr:hypothetical protein [Streptomyces alboflavus]ARX81516.1 hypothetical protein SMD44_00914 [Streptomyces alboflavus]
MPDTYEVIAVTEYWPNPDTPCWAVDMRKPDGGTYRHVFPTDTLAWRAAEYGLDPADTAALLDVVLHEPFAPHPDDPITAADDPVLAAGLMSPANVSRGTVRAGDPVPTTLYTAETAQAAREAHLMRIAHARTHVVRVSVPKGKASPLAVITRQPLDAADVAARASKVEANRRRVQARPEAPVVLDSAADRRNAELKASQNKKETSGA